jgi:hypothetical protein
MKTLFAFLLALACGVAHAQVSQIQPFQPCNNTITFTANVSGSLPSPVQAICQSSPSSTNQYVITNTGSVTAFISYAGSSATATANAVIPTSTTQAVYVLLPMTQVTITTGGGSWFCGITSSGTAVIYIQPGFGS